MKRFSFKKAVLVLVFTFAGALSAHAQDDMNQEKHAWYIPEIANVGIGVHGGWMNSKDADSGEGFGGAHLRFRALSFLGIEVSGDVMEETFKNKSVDVYETPLNLSVLIYPIGAPFTYLPTPVSPYLVGGASWVYFRTNFRGPLVGLQNASSEAETNRALGWHAGIGLDIGVTKNVTFNIEYRDTFWDFNKNIDNAIVRAGLPPISTNNYQVRGGLTFLFH